MTDPNAEHLSPRSTSGLRVNGGRLHRRLAELAEEGAIGGGGCSRLALTDADRAGRNLVTTWMRDLGLDVTVDAIGNVVGRLGDPGTAPVMMGSHIDTVASAGRFDGNLGVLAGLEVLETLIESDFETSRPVAVAFFTNEEGSRFAPDMLGSLAYAGGIPLESALDIRGIDGAVVGDELKRIGYAGPNPCPGPVPHAFVELHIEQGPVLEAHGAQIGVVEGVQGISWQELTVEGQANHAGTTPMSLRHDSAYAAARIATFVRELARDLGPPQVGTVGSIRVHPSLVNVIADSTILTVDLRNTDNSVLREAEQRVSAFTKHIASIEGVTITGRPLARFDPVEFDPAIVSLVQSVATRMGLSTLRLPSGAGHDAQMISRVCKSGMIFVPSKAGISHNPAEYTAPEQVNAGADVLLQVVLELAGTEDAIDSEETA